MATWQFVLSMSSGRMDPWRWLRAPCVSDSPRLASQRPAPFDSLVGHLGNDFISLSFNYFTCKMDIIISLLTELSQGLNKAMLTDSLCLWNCLFLRGSWYRHFTDEKFQLGEVTCAVSLLIIERGRICSDSEILKPHLLPTMLTTYLGISWPNYPASKEQSWSIVESRACVLWCPLRMFLVGFIFSRFSLNPFLPVPCYGIRNWWVRLRMGRCICRAQKKVFELFENHKYMMPRECPQKCQQRHRSHAQTLPISIFP